MQVLWCEALEGNRPITVDKFLYYYKHSEIKKSTGFYQFSSRGSYYSLIKDYSSSDRLWKKEFFIISGNWAGDPTDVGNPFFPPFTSPLGHLRPEGMFPFHFILCFLIRFLSFFRLTLSFGDAAVIRPCLDSLFRPDRRSLYLPWENFSQSRYSQSSSNLGAWSITYC